MPELYINRAGEHGIVRSIRPHELPLNAWSSGQNIRFKDDYAEKTQGHIAPFSTPTIAPYHLLAVPAATHFWMLLGLAKVHVWDGSAYTDITRASGGDYGASADLNWTTSILNGIPILNNGVDAPQMWSPQTAATDLVALTNWPAGMTARSLRAFKNYLVALDVTKAGTRYKQMVKWSHPASPGAVPISWDETAATRDAGETVLSETPGTCIDALALRDTMVIYKDDSTWGMQVVGGVAVFRFFKIFGTLGLLTRRCAVEFFSGKHLAFGFNDIYLHNGQQAESVVESRLKDWLYNNIDPLYYVRSFIVHNLEKSEVWFCFPIVGATLPNIALVWNYARNTAGFRDLPGVAHIGEGGVVFAAGMIGGATYNAATGTFDANTMPYGDDAFTASRTKMLMAVPAGPQVYAPDLTNLFAGASFTSSLERTRLGVPKSLEDQQQDFRYVKTSTNIWPRIEGTQGATVNVYLSANMEINEPVVWGDPLPFVIGTTKKLDKIATGRHFNIKYESSGDVDWRLHGYVLEGVVGGLY